MVQNFSFLIPGILAGSAIPGYWQDNLEEELLHLKDKRIIAIISLTEWTLNRSVVARSGITHYCHIPIPDFGCPTFEQIEQMLQFIETVTSTKQGAVLIHCFAGQGRTGLMLAAYLISKGKSATEAIDTVRTKRPGSIETAFQEKRLHLFAEEWKQKKEKEKERQTLQSDEQHIPAQRTTQ